MARVAGRMQKKRRPKAKSAAKGSTATTALPREMPTISLCMIVKDEEGFLRPCLDSVKGLVDEMVIVDTGSADNTVATAEFYGARVLHYEWNDDFAAARQVSFDAATCDYILWLDADERLSPSSGEAIRTTLCATDENSYFIKILNYQTLDGKLSFTHYLPRLFKRQEGLTIRNRLHEQIDMEFLSQNGQMGGIERAEIVHLGYVPEIIEAKHKKERNLEILETMVAERPQDPYAQFKLGGTYVDMEMYAEALSRLERAEELMTGRESYMAMLHVLAAASALRLGRGEPAQRHAEAAVQTDPDMPDARFVLGQCHKRNGRYVQAVEQFEAAIRTPDQFSLSTVDPSTRGLRAHFELAGCYLSLGDPAKALDHFQTVVRESPDLGMAWHGAGICLLALDRPQEAVQALRNATKLVPGDPEAWANLGAAYGKQSLHKAAQEAMARSLAISPNQPSTLSNLGLAFLNQGKHGEAEEKLRAALALDPSNYDTLLRLSQIARSQERPDEAVRWLEMLVERHPENPGSWLSLADLYLFLGHTEPARIALAMADKVAPGSQAVVEMASMLPPPPSSAAAGPQPS